MRTHLILALASVLALPSSLQAQGTRTAVSWGALVGNSAWHEESFVDLDACSSYSAGLRADGSIAAWGFSFHGQCHVPALPGLTYTAISAGTDHMLGLRSDGYAIGWGLNDSGQCTVPAAPAGATYVAIASGRAHSLGLLSNGTVVGWGNNSFGQATVPPLPAGLAYTRIAAAHYQSLALRSDGALVAFGSSVVVPSLPIGATAVQLAVGKEFGAVRASDGSILAWGLNHAGQLNVPALPPGTTYVDLALGDSHGVAARSDGAVVAWGSNDKGQVSGVATLPAGSYVQVACGEKHSLARRSDGRVFSWGSNAAWQRNIPPPPAGREFVQFAAAGYGVNSTSSWISGHVLLDDGTITSWGDPVVPPALPAGMTYTLLRGGVGGYFKVAALRSDGAVVIWGGMTPPNGVHSPPPGVSYVDLDAGYIFAAALRDDGQIDQFFSTFSSLPPPPALPPGMTYVDLATGSTHALALRSDGQVIAWGDNPFGECNVPPLPAGQTYLQVGAGSGASVAVRSDGTIVTWGNFGIWSCAPPGNVAELDAGPYNHFVRYTDGTVRGCGPNQFFELDIPSLPAGRRWTQVHAQSAVSFGLSEPASGIPYCTAKVNGLGCVPSIGSTGFMSATQTSGYAVWAVSMRNHKPGLLLYTGSGRAATPFGGGTLCLSAPVRRTPGLQSGGTAPPANDCTGAYGIDMNAFRAGLLGGNPAAFLSIPGAIVDSQFWGRDPGFPPPNNVALSDALEFVVQP